jgi:hypothetical protein
MDLRQELTKFAVLSVTIPEAVDGMAGNRVIINRFGGLHFCIAVLLIKACDHYLVWALNTYQVQGRRYVSLRNIAFLSVAPSAHRVFGEAQRPCVAG